MSELRGHPVLLEFWDFCRPNSIRTLPYMKAWHERYEPDGLRVLGVHSAGFPPSEDPVAVQLAVARLSVPYPVVVDVDHAIWKLYENRGWPARYLFTADGRLFDYHYGEGAYQETELAIQELLGVSRPPLPPIRPEDAAGALLVPQTQDVAGPYSGPYEAGGVWAVLSGQGHVSVARRVFRVTGPGAYELVTHPHSTTGVFELSVGEGVECHAVCFTPGLAGPGVTG
jgi:hypothetical protein